MRIGKLLLLLAIALVSRAADAPSSPPIDVLMRLKGVDLAANPAVRNALNRALEATRGTPPFLELIRAFNLTDQSAGLIDLALAHADDSTGAEALQRVIEDGGTDALREALTGPRAAAVAQALGNVSDESAPSLLAPVVADGRRDLAVRQAAVRALVRSEAGAGRLLELAREKKLADDVKALAATELAGIRWPALKDEAAQVLPVAAAAEGTLVSLENALALRGDASRGESVFFGAAACGSCHQVKGRGIDFGPGLSEIGDKFGKPALYAAIVDPNAGIVFGYELWEITLRNGAAFGFITSETDDEVAVKAPGNIVTRHRKSEIVSRRSIPGSSMPAGLLQPLAAQEVADLLEYLSSLKPAR